MGTAGGRDTKERFNEGPFMTPGFENLWPFLFANTSPLRSGNRRWGGGGQGCCTQKTHRNGDPILCKPRDGTCLTSKAEKWSAGL